MPGSDVPLGGGGPPPRLWRRSNLGFLQKLLLASAVGALVALVVLLADVLLLVFGAVLVAVLLHAIAEPLVRRARIGRAASLTLAVLLLTVAAATTLWLFGQEASVQLAALGELVPRAWTELEGRLSGSPLGAYLLEDLRRFAPSNGVLASFGAALVRDTAAGAAAALIVMFSGLYLAFHPETYLSGVLKLTPPAARPRAAVVLAQCGEALNRWLLGLLISMVLIGVTTGVGLWLAGVPSPLALGVLAALGQAVPVVGPAAAMLLGLLVAMSEGPETLLWAAIVYVGAMQLEANVITPLLLRQMVQLPMAVTLFAVLAMGVLLGPLGVLFATPLAVVTYVLVRAVYVEGVLGDRPVASGPDPPDQVGRTPV